MPARLPLGPNRVSACSLSSSAAISAWLTASHPNSEVKQVRAGVVLRWGTTREGPVLRFCFLFLSLAALNMKKKEEVYTRPLPLTSCQEDPPWVWTIGSCAMADLVYQFGRTVLEGMFRENLAPMEIRPPGFLVRGWSQDGN